MLSSSHNSYLFYIRQTSKFKIDSTEFKVIHHLSTNSHRQFTLSEAQKVEVTIFVGQQQSVESVKQKGWDL